MLVAVFTATGSHWFVLQTIAWGGMLSENLRERPLVEAVQRTFDGEHPCSLCVEISNGKKAEKKPEFRIDLKKFDFVLQAQRFIFIAPEEFTLLPEWSADFQSQTRQPSVPPPRTATA
jgi:hypothetical protein